MQAPAIHSSGLQGHLVVRVEVAEDDWAFAVTVITDNDETHADSVKFMWLATRPLLCVIESRSRLLRLSVCPSQWRRRPDEWTSTPGCYHCCLVRYPKVRVVISWSLPVL